MARDCDAGNSVKMQRELRKRTNATIAERRVTFRGSVLIQEAIRTTMASLATATTTTARLSATTAMS